LKAKSLITDVAITTNSDIGTFVYISRAIGVPLDTVVKWFILVIVLVFDPLSICLVLAYNFLIQRENKKEEPSPEEPKTFAVYDEKPKVNENPTVESVEPIIEVETPKIVEQNLPTYPQEILDKLNSTDPFPQYMTRAETNDVLEDWWARRNGAK
jgi:hypothetical protein